MSTLRAAHGADPAGTRMGVDVLAGAAGDMKQLGIFESYRVKKQVRVRGRRSCVCLHVLSIKHCATTDF